MHIATECTQNHTAEFPLTVSARHCNREEAISKPRLLVCQKRRTDRSLCCNCWLCCWLLTERPTKINTNLVSCIIVCKAQVALLFLCLYLYNGEQSNSILSGSHLQNFWRLAAAAQLQRASLERSVFECIY